MEARSWNYTENQQWGGDTVEETPPRTPSFPSSVLTNEDIDEILSNPSPNPLWSGSGSGGDDLSDLDLADFFIPVQEGVDAREHQTFAELTPVLPQHGSPTWDNGQSLPGNLVQHVPGAAPLVTPVPVSFLCENFGPTAPPQDFGPTQDTRAIAGGKIKKQKGAGRPKKNTEIETDLSKYTPDFIAECLKRPKNYSKPQKQVSQTADARRNQDKTELAEGSVELFWKLVDRTINLDFGDFGAYNNILRFYMMYPEQAEVRRFWMKKHPEAFVALLMREYPQPAHRPWLEMQATQVKELHMHSVQETKPKGKATKRSAC